MILELELINNKARLLNPFGERLYGKDWTETSFGKNELGDYTISLEGNGDPSRVYENITRAGFSIYKSKITQTKLK